MPMFRHRVGVTTFGVVLLLLAPACASSPEEPSPSPTTGTASASSTTRSPTSTPAPATTTSSPKPTTATPTKPKQTSRTTTPAPITPGPSTPAPKVPIPASLIGHAVGRIPTSSKVVALTFDAGANGDGVDSIVATLAREKVASTFFLTGDFVDSYPALAIRMSAAGRLGNHTTDHPHLPTLTDAQLRTQVTSARTTILRVTGEDPRPLFRFPFGDSGQRELRLVNDLGYVAVGWTVDTLGWQGTSGGRTVDSVVQRVLSAATPGEIVLMHVGSNPRDHSTLDADALPRIISGLRAAGYSFLTLDALGAG